MHVFVCVHVHAKWIVHSTENINIADIADTPLKENEHSVDTQHILNNQ